MKVYAHGSLNCGNRLFILVSQRQARGAWGSPRFPLKGSFKGDIDIGIDIDVDINIALDARGT